MRHVVPAAIAAAAMVGAPLATPASAQSAVQIHCWPEVCWVEGVIRGRVLPNPEYVTVEFTVNSACLQGTGSGTVYGALNVDINWTRLGMTGVVSSSGDVDGMGVVSFEELCPQSHSPRFDITLAGI